MPVLEEEVEVLEGADADAPTSDDLHLAEAAQISEEAVQDDGTLILNLIRPCVGRGRGSHLYKAEMLEANAGKFAGWKMYLNHLSEAARRALGGLPRDVRDTGGIVLESWWNPDVPAEGRFGQGAVQGRVKGVALINSLIDVDPRLIEASINATATGVKPGKVGGQRVWIVEGIEDRGSVDWVTEGGAGGKVAEIMEALIEEGDYAENATLAGLSDDELIEYVKKNRPDLAEAFAKKNAKVDPDEDGDDDAKELKAEADKLIASGKAKSMPQALALARAALAKKKVNETAEQEDDLPKLAPEDLREALTETDEGKAVLREAVVEAVKDLNLGSEVASLLEARLEDDREVTRAEIRAAAERREELRDMRVHAHAKIEESKLATPIKDRLRREFDISEGKPTRALDLVNDEDADGHVVKSAQEKLNEALTEAINDGLKLMAEINRTSVRGQGPVLVEGEEVETRKDKDGNDLGPDRVGDTTRGLLEGLRIPDADKVWSDPRFSLA
jgi:hypothetical protein